MSFKGLLKHQHDHHTFSDTANDELGARFYGPDSEKNIWKDYKELFNDHKLNHKASYFRGKPHTHIWTK